MPRLPTAAFVVLLSAMILALGIGDAFAERRVALVIGNAKYKDANIALTNSSNDAEDVAGTLKTLGFDVALMLNATTREMDIALKRFSDFATTADTALFYYAGHALQFQGNNYLMPVDAQLEDEVDLRRSMVSDDQIRAALDRAKGVRIMILDACRNNPLADRFKRSVLGMSRAVELTRGLARVDRAQGMLVAYAAAPGEVALDGNTTGRNSPFANALVRWMKEPAIEISTMFRRVTNDVVTQTRGQQRPEYTSTLRNDYFLDPLADRRVWERVRESNDPGQIREFINQFPFSMHMLDAQRRIDILERSRNEREEQARIERERIERERVRAQLCQRERDELQTLGSDFAKLQAFAQRAACEEARTAANARIGAIVAQRDEAARREEARRRDEEERQRAERCRNELATVNALGNDLARLQEFVKQATCEPARTLASNRIAEVIAQRETESRRRQEAERICRDEQQTLTTIWNDLSKLQGFAQSATCEQVRTTAAERIKSVVAQRERDEAEARQRQAAEAARQATEAQQRQTAEAARQKQAEEAQRLAAEAARLAAEAQRQAAAAKQQQSAEAQRKAAEAQQAEAARQQQAEEARRRAAEAEQQAAAAQQQQAAEAQRRATEAARQAAEAQQQAARNCQNDRAAMAQIWDDGAKLQELAQRSTCAEVRQTLAARIESLAAAQRQELALRQHAAERLAALEDERNRQQREEDQRRRAEQERAQAEQECKNARVEVAAIDGDLAKLKGFVTRTDCNEVRAFTAETIARIEREEKACADESNRRTALLNQVKGTRDVTRLTRSKDDMAKLEQGMTCARERPTVAEALGTIRVQIAQVELRRVGCFSGNNDGTLNDATREGAKRFLVALGRPETGGDVTEDLLSALKDQKKVPVCKAAPPPAGATPPVAARPKPEPPRRQATRPPRQERQERADPPPRATTQAERPQPAPRAPTSSGGGMIGVGF